MNVYCGKESSARENEESLTLGERVVKSLASTIKEKDVVLCFDRFFTSVHLLETLNFAALGTCMSNRKNVPTMKEKLQRGQSIFRCTNSGLLCTKWQDTKEVIVMSNCHKPDLTTVTKKTKTGERQPTECPEVISFYRQKMGGVDRADQLVGLYDHDRKSNKWWKKVFYTCLNMCAVNAWILYNDLRRENKKTPFLSFLVTLAEELIAEGTQNTSLPPPNKKRKIYGAVPLHLPVEGQTRRRCSRCSEAKHQKRTKTICQECNIPLCKDCFMLYHVKDERVNTNRTRESISELICDNATDSVCCTAPRTSSSYGKELSDRRYCGFQHTDDYSYNRNDTAIDEFPWLAAILGIDFCAQNEEERVMCHGILINYRYLLSVAHCYIGVNERRYNITKVLLGEYHRSTSEDCVELSEFEITECNKAEQYQIEEKIIHPFYLKSHPLADIALLRLNKAVTFSDYVRPICLPIQGTVFANVGDVLYTTGWGLLTYNGDTADKKKIPTVLVSGQECQHAYKNDLPVFPAMSYICTLDFQNNTAYSCQGDSGAPVMFKHKNQLHVEGIVSRIKFCGLSSPGLQVRVTSYLEWIKQSIRP